MFLRVYFSKINLQDEQRIVRKFEPVKRQTILPFYAGRQLNKQSVLVNVHTVPENNLNLHVKTEPVTAGADTAHCPRK